MSCSGRRTARHALEDLERYLELSPRAPDATQVRQWMVQIAQAARAGSVRS